MYEVFISYRRSDGTELARTIKEILSNDYKVFFDHSSLRDGKWKIKLNQLKFLDNQNQVLWQQKI